MNILYYSSNAFPLPSCEQEFFFLNFNEYLTERAQTLKGLAQYVIMISLPPPRSFMNCNTACVNLSCVGIAVASYGRTQQVNYPGKARPAGGLMIVVSVYM